MISIVLKQPIKSQHGFLYPGVEVEQQTHIEDEIDKGPQLTPILLN